MGQTNEIQIAIRRRDLKMDEEDDARVIDLRKDNTELRKKAKYLKKRLKYTQESFEKKLKGEMRNPHLPKDCATQTITTCEKDIRKVRKELEKVSKRREDLRKRVASLGGKLNRANAETKKLRSIAKTHEEKGKNMWAKIQELKEKYDTTVSELQRKNEELQEELQRYQRRESHHQGRQTGRGRDAATAFAGILQYMTEPQQQY